MVERTICGQWSLRYEEDRQRADEHRADAEADGDNEQVVRKCECTDHAVERETCIEDFEIKEGAEARLCYLPGGCDRRFEDMVHNLDADEGQQTGDRRHEERVCISGREHQRSEIEIGRAHVCTPVPNAHLVSRRLLEKTKKQTQLS